MGFQSGVWHWVHNPISIIVPGALLSPPNSSLKLLVGMQIAPSCPSTLNTTCLRSSLPFSLAGNLLTFVTLALIVSIIKIDLNNTVFILVFNIHIFYECQPIFQHYFFWLYFLKGVIILYNKIIFSNIFVDKKKKLHLAVKPIFTMNLAWNGGWYRTRTYDPLLVRQML